MTTLSTCKCIYCWLFKQFNADCKLKPTGEYAMNKFQAPNILKVCKSLTNNHNQTVSKVRK